MQAATFISWGSAVETSDHRRIGRRLERGNGHQVGSSSLAVDWDQYNLHRDPQFESNTREYYIATSHYHLVIYSENAGHQIPVGSLGELMRHELIDSARMLDQARAPVELWWGTYFILRSSPNYGSSKSTVISPAHHILRKLSPKRPSQRRPCTRSQLVPLSSAFAIRLARHQHLSCFCALQLQLSNSATTC